MIAQSRIRKVIYSWDDQHDSDVYRASRIILQMAGVETIHYIPTVDSVVLDLRTDDDDDVAAAANPDNTTIFQDKDKENINASTAAAAIDTNDNENLRDMLLREANWIPPNVPAKRKNVISWDDYFMAMAFLTAKRSKDPNTQVGACIVSRDNVILALGYNGFPRGCLDDCLPWARQAAVVANQPLSSSSSSSLHTKYPYVCHAEVNAILNKGSADVRDATLFVALFPCNECAKMIIQAGIVEVVYLQDHYHDTDMCRASRILFGMAGVKLRKLVPSVHTIRIELQR
ncbi:MafB19-like deaminase [Fragilaria crotonensis]|nr:MafB19-like deaminase [Fragilaria crotonensis]